MAFTIIDCNNNKITILNAEYVEATSNGDDYFDKQGGRYLGTLHSSGVLYLSQKANYTLQKAHGTTLQEHISHALTMLRHDTRTTHAEASLLKELKQLLEKFDSRSLIFKD